MPELRAAAFPTLVIVALLLSIVYPAAFTYAYSESATTYRIAHESTDAYAETLAREDLEPGTPVDITSLSAAEQRALAEAKTQPVETRAESHGWQSLGSVPVCNERLVVCDEYEAPPRLPRNVDGSSLYGLVEDDGDVYLTYSSFPGDAIHFGPLASLVTRVLVPLPYVAFLCVVGLARRNVSRTEQLAFEGYGLFVAAIGVAGPYLYMSDLLPVPPYEHAALIGATWLVMLVGLCRICTGPSHSSARDPW